MSRGRSAEIEDGGGGGLRLTSGALSRSTLSRTTHDNHNVLTIDEHRESNGDGNGYAQQTQAENGTNSITLSRPQSNSLIQGKNNTLFLTFLLTPF